MTLSLVARCASTGEFGLAIASSSPAVAARCAFARAGVGAVATQNVTDPTLGPAALDLMAGGARAAEAVAILGRERAHMAHRQLLAVDRHGGTAVHTGAKGLGTTGEARGAEGVVAAGNLLGHAGVPAAMVAAMAETAMGGAGGPLADRLLAALRAGREAGGEAGPLRSAGLLVVRGAAWPFVDLRVDWSEDGACPVEALGRLWAVYAPQAEDYLRRALDPEAAPSFGVPGDP